jgi:hypothetical protein
MPDEKIEQTTLEQDLATTEVVIPVGELKLSEPHWRVDRKDLLQTLQVINSFLSASTLLVSLGFEKTEAGDFIRISSTNKDYYFSRTIPLKNKMNLAETTKLYFVKLDVLTTLAKSYDDFAFTFSEDLSKLTFYNNYISYRFDLFDLKGFNFNPTDVGGTFTALQLSSTMLSSIHKLFGFSMRTSDNKASCIGPSLFGSFMIYSFMFSQAGNFEFPFTLRKVDVEVLLNVLQFADGLFYYVGAGRVYITWSSGYISFLTVEPAKNYMNVVQGEQVGTLSLDREIFQRSLSVATALGVSVITFYQQDGAIYVSSDANLKSAKATCFKVGTGDLADPTSFSLDIIRKDIAAVASILPVLTVKVYETGIIIEFVDGKDVYSYALSKLTVGAVERQKKLETKAGKREEYTEKKKAAGEYKKKTELGASESLEDVLKKS